MASERKAGAVGPARSYWRLGPGLLTARPKLAFALVAGLAVVLACARFAPALRPHLSAIAGWDAFCALYLGLTFHAMAGKRASGIRVHAAREDQGQAVILVLILAACVASLAAAAMELSAARAGSGGDKALHIAAAFGTVAASWLVMQTVLAVHYAHEYYAADPETGRDLGGLVFPGGEPPDYWDYLHFSIVIGVAAQTADVAIAERRLRRLATVHSLIAFAFNTVIVALTINLLAGLFPAGGAGAGR